jgi:ATP-binding cassette, subfamily B, bacterial
MKAQTVELAASAWPLGSAGDALVALARRSALLSKAATASRHPPVDDPAALDRWLTAAGDQLGVSVEPMTATYRELDGALAVMHPAIVRLDDSLLVVLGGRGGELDCLGPDGLVRRVSRQAVVRALQTRHQEPQRERVAELLARAALSGSSRARAEAGILDELLATATVMHAWLLRLPPGAPFGAQLRAAGLYRLAAQLLAAHIFQYVLFLASWWAIGHAVLGDHLAPGWLGGWALMLLGSVVLLMISTWCQGRLAMGIGALLRRRLLAGALALPPEMLSRDGIGRLMGRAIEADSLERLALGGGFSSALALLELALAAPALAAGPGGWWHAALVGIWLVFAALFGIRLARARSHWTDQRLELTSVTIEHVVGHRTRLAQELPDRWHAREDDALSPYLDRSAVLDRRSLALLVMVPRGWLVAGLAALAPAFVSGSDTVALGAGVGGVILVWLSLARLSNGLDLLAGAYVAWRRVAPLFHAASHGLVEPDGAHAPQTRNATAPEHLIAPPATGTEPVLEAIDVSFRPLRRAADVLSGCDLVIHRGDRVLLQGPSGGGKSTLVSVLAGLKMPRTGLVLARGLDMSCLGEVGWRSRVSAAPQFHENHILTETFAFNVLMSRSWPPRPEELDEARAVCEELGLGPLLARMPGGMFQLVGETGWQLSHGERSRVFIARALLQDCDTVILDESLAALDPENMALTLRCLRARARSLLVVAHP